MQNKDKGIFDVFLSHSHDDAIFVEKIAEKLEDKYNLKVWLDKWILIPGEPFRQTMYRGLEEAKTCAVIVGNGTPKGWFEEEIGKALQKQTKDKKFRVIPVLLPNSKPDFISDFLELRTWVDLKNGIEDESKFLVLVCGIKGIPPGRLKKDSHKLSEKINGIIEKLEIINKLHKDELIEKSIKIEYQRILVDELIGKNNEK